MNILATETYMREVACEGADGMNNLWCLRPEEEVGMPRKDGEYVLQGFTWRNFTTNSNFGVYGF